MTVADKLAAHVHNCQALLDEWASDLGIKIEWVHGWEKDDTLRATAFGYHPGTSNNPATMTVVVPKVEAEHNA